MTALHFMFAWANAPYTVVGGIAIVFALLQASGLLGVLAGSSDHDLDADGDVDADTDVDGDHDADHDSDDAHGFGAALLGPLGVGKIPLSLVWQSFSIV
ncbi:MAG TPA: hypothetical protein VF407_02750, partial [Polyangiaceae bacterium]